MAFLYSIAMVGGKMPRHFAPSIMQVAEYNPSKSATCAVILTPYMRQDRQTIQSSEVAAAWKTHRSDPIDKAEALSMA